MFFLKLIRKFYKGLAGAESPTQIALGFGLGCILGLIPFHSGLAILTLVIILIFKVSFPFAVLAWAITGALRVSVLSQFLASFGFWVLETIPLHGLWTALLNLPVVRLMGLQYYLVMGGAVTGTLIGLILFYPICFLVRKYREMVVKKLSGSKLFKTITNLWLFRIIRWVFVGN